MSAPELVPPGGWILSAQPRLRPPARPSLLLRALSGIARSMGRSEVPDIFKVFMLNPRLFWPWLAFASQLMPWGRLRPAERELVIMRVGWNCRSRYEWGQHLEIGLRSGLTDADIVGVARGPEAFSGRRQLLLQAVDQLCQGHGVSEANWQALREHYDEKRLIEIVILTGHYVMVAGFLNAAGIALEPVIENHLQMFHQRVGGNF